MTVFSKFWRLSWQEKELLCEAALLLTFAQIIIKFVPYPVWSKSLGPVKKPSPSAFLANSVPDPNLPRVLWAVTAISRRLPWTVVCLPKAMVSKWMLTRRNIPSQLHVGVKRSDKPNTAKPVELHAWLRVGSDIVTGGDVADQFTPLAIYGT